MKDDKFNEMAKVKKKKKNGFITFTVSDHLLESVMKHIYMQDLDRPPNNKQRKIVFKDFCGLDKSEKLSVVGKLIGRQSKVNEEAIYQCMLDINEIGKKITIGSLAKLLKCSSRTIHRNMSKELKQEKDILNRDNEKI